MFSNVDAAVPAHEVDKKSFADDYDDFIKLQRRQRSLPLNALTSFMANSLLNRTFSFGEHMDYQPVIEELAYYVVQWRKQFEPSEVSLDQAIILLQYGMQYNITNPQFWQIVQEIAEANIGADLKSFNQIMEIVTLLRDQNLLTNKILRSVAAYILHTNLMSSSELVFFTQVFTSSEMQSAFDIRQKDQLKELEETLCKHIENLTVREFSIIANVIGYSATGNDDDFINFNEFLIKSLPQVQKWIQDNEIINVDELIQIVGAYSESNIEKNLTKDFYTKLETHVLNTSSLINYRQAIDLVSYMADYASSETMEVFDRIIGSKHSLLTPHEAFDALMAFSSAKVATVRPKIFQVLFKKLSENFDRLSSSQLCLLVDLVSRDSDKDLLERLELNKFLQRRLSSLNTNELVTCYIALGRQNDVALHKQVEELIITNITQFNVETLTDLLYHQAKERVADKYLMKVIVEQLGLKKADTRFTPAPVIAQALISFNLVGVSTIKNKGGKASVLFIDYASALEDRIQDLSREELHLLDKILRSANQPSLKNEADMQLVMLQQKVEQALK